jgi:Tol biopolymer transport system component
VVRLALVVAFVALLLPAAAAGSQITFVCGQDLCRSDGEGGGVVRLTTDGARLGGYSRPTVSRDGRRLAFKVGDPGRAYTSDALAKRRTRIAPAPDGPRDATQFDVAISPDGRRVAWVETRINVVFGSIDYRRYSATAAGAGAVQRAANGGRPFVAWFDPQSILREGVTGAAGQTASPDQGICIPDPKTKTNGVCGRLVAFDERRHLRHPSISPNGRYLAATAYAPPGEDMDNAIERPGAIALFDTRSGRLVRDLTTGPADSGPSFSPDGRFVAFERRGSIYAVPVTGGKPRLLIRRGSQPAWSR